MDQMPAAPGKPIPAVCGDWATTKAVYHFFDNQRLADHSILAGRFAATATSGGPILILQDTTEFICSRAQPGSDEFNVPEKQMSKQPSGVQLLDASHGHAALAARQIAEDIRG